MNRHTTFSFTVVPNREQEQALRRHVGAARFAFIANFYREPKLPNPKYSQPHVFAMP